MHTQLDEQPPLRWPEHIHHRLANGLQVALTPLNHLSTVTVMVFVRVGSRHEEAADSGLSHLLEHVLFRGCDGYPDALAFNTAVEACATGIGAATSREHTVFDATCFPSALPRILSLLGAMLSSPRFADVALEKQIVSEELLDEVDDTGRDVDVDNITMLKLFPGPGLGAKIGGHHKRVQQLTEADCRRWFQRFYTAANMQVSIAGRFDPETAITLVADILGVLTTGVRAPTVAPTLREDLPALEFVKNRSPQTDVQLSWPTVSRAHADWPALFLAQRLFDDGTCARLRHRVVDQLGLAYHAACDLDTFEDTCILTIDTQSSPGNAIDVIDTIGQVVNELAMRPPDHAEMKRIRQRVRFELATLCDAPSSLAYWIGLQIAQQSADTLETRYNRIMSVTAQQVSEACANRLSRQGLQLTVVGELSAMNRAALRRRLHAFRAPGSA